MNLELTLLTTEGDCSHFCTVHRRSGMKDAISKVSCEMLKLESHRRWQTVNAQCMLRANVMELGDVPSVPLVGREALTSTG